MLITFKSKAAADVLMYEAHAKPILDLLRKEPKRGIITAAEAPAAISMIEAEIADSKSRLPAGEAERDDVPAQAEDGDDPQQERKQAVSFSTRAYPLLEMLRAAQRGNHDVMWGV